MKDGLVLNRVRVRGYVCRREILGRQLMRKKPLIISKLLQSGKQVRILLGCPTECGGPQLEHVRAGKFPVERRDQAGKNFRRLISANARAIAVRAFGITGRYDDRSLFTAAENILERVIERHHTR